MDTQRIICDDSIPNLHPTLRRVHTLRIDEGTKSSKAVILIEKLKLRDKTESVIVEFHSIEDTVRILKALGSKLKKCVLYLSGSLKSLESIELNVECLKLWIGDNDCTEMFKFFKNIKNLHLMGFSPKNESVLEILVKNNLRTLEKLKIDYVFESESDEKTHDYLKEIKYLRVFQTSGKNKAFKSVLGEFPLLETLGVLNCELKCEDVQKIKILKNLKNFSGSHLTSQNINDILEIESLERVEFSESDILEINFEKSINLKELSLCNVKVSNQALETCFKSTPILRDLSFISLVGITSEVFVIISKHLKYLKNFYIEGIDFLGDFPEIKMSQLNSFSLTNSKLLNKFLKSFWAEHLINIDLCNSSEITDEGIGFLVGNCPNLKYVDISGCTGLTNLSVNILSSNLTNVLTLIARNCNGFSLDVIGIVLKLSTNLEYADFSYILEREDDDLFEDELETMAKTKSPLLKVCKSCLIIYLILNLISHYSRQRRT
ncbi:hypothetical protein ACFFRR_006814 [Megaselia abdita]